MATHDYVIANDTAANVRADLNNALAAIVSNNSSATAPATTYANMWWYDSTNDILKIRNEADTDWIDVFTVNQTDSQIEFTTVNATNYGDGTDSVPASAVLEGTAKVHGASLAGAAATPAYNISSVTDVSTGVYTFTPTNVFSSTAYTAIGGGDPRGTTVNTSTGVVKNTASSFTSYTELSNGSPGDENVNVVAWGDLA